MPRKSKAETEVKPVEADPIAPDMIPNDQREGEEAFETDWSKPISSTNPPPSKRPLREQHSPVSDEDVLQKDQRDFDEELDESEKEVARKTGTTARRTRVTDVGADVGGDAVDTINVSTSNPSAGSTGRGSTK